MIKIETLNQNFRRAVASQDIKEGTVILEKPPIAFAVYPWRRKELCNFCFKQQSNLAFCQSCKTFYYCSRDCQKSDWNIHKQECKALAQIVAKGYQVTSQFILLLRLYILSKQNQQIINSEIDGMIALRESFPEEKIQFFQEISYMIMKQFDQEEVSETNLQKLIKLNCQISLNAFTIQDPLCEGDGIATGIYPQAYFFNHSCYPNAAQVFVGQKLKIVATRQIQKNEEIYIAYLDVSKAKNERVKFTQQHYFFECKCERCLQDDQIEQLFSQIKCQKCKRGGVTGSSLQCSKCQFVNNQATINQYEERLKTLSELCLKDQTKVPQLVEYYIEINKICLHVNRNHQPLIRKATLQLIDQQQFEKAYLMLKIHVKHFLIWHGQELPMLGWLYNELCKLAFYLQKDQKAEKYGSNAKKILIKYYTDEKIKEIEELFIRLQDIQAELKMKSSYN